MPLIYSETLNEFSILGVWQITEPEAFYLEKVPLTRPISHPQNRLQHLAARYTLKAICPDFPINDIRVTESGKPFLAGNSHYFSLSHCRDYAAAIISTKHKVGIDAEPPGERVLGIRHKFISPADYEALENAGLSPDASNATLLWSIKESLFKWQDQTAVDFKAHLQIKTLDPVAQQGTAFIAKPGVMETVGFSYKRVEKIWVSWVDQP